MTLGIRKLVVLVLVGSVFLLANVLFVVSWLDEHGVVSWAQHIRTEYVTGTAITIIITLMILLVGGRRSGIGLLRHCPVCDHRLMGRGAYCSDCGSKV